MTHDPTFPIIALDMDGFLADFVQAALDLHCGGIDPRTVTGWNGIPDAINAELPDDHGLVTTNSMWHRIGARGADFWEALEPYPWTDQLVKLVENAVPAQNIYIVTTPTNSPDSYAGKVRWVRQHMPDHLDRLVMCRNKSMLAQPGRLLIDDGTHNTEAWEAAGGTAAEWPMPWNTRVGETAYDKLDQAVELVQLGVKTAAAGARAARALDRLVDVLLKAQS